MGKLSHKFICYRDFHIMKKVNYVHIDKFNHLKGENLCFFQAVSLERNEFMDFVSRSLANRQEHTHPRLNSGTFLGWQNIRIPLVRAGMYPSLDAHSEAVSEASHDSWQLPRCG